MSSVPITIPEDRYIRRIPNRNMWLLMFYASDLFASGRDRRDIEDRPDEIANLVGEILANLVEKRLRRNLSFGYVRREETLSRVRGRIQLLKTHHFF